MNHCYHLVAPDFRGNTLYSLNGLLTAFPDLYLREKEKYVDRESVLSCNVPGLGVPWADTVNLSVLDPRLLVAERLRLGVPFSQLLTRRLLRIPIDRIAHLPAVIYNSRSHWLNSSPGDSSAALTPPDEDFTPFDASLHMEVPEVPILHVEYLQRQLARGERALGFVFVPHILVTGQIDVSGLDPVDL